LIVAQATGGAGKTFVVRGLAKAMWNASTFAIRSNERILESASDRAKGHLGVTRCPVRVELNGSQAVRAIDGAAVMVALPAAVWSHTAWLDSVSYIAISANSASARKSGFAPGHFNPSHR
jgi:hypothetical protein